ncbi:histone lysine methyltransferase Set9, partial [Rhizina undulata]
VVHAPSRHARRYLSVYLPDASFEVSSTNRYSPVSSEACIIARKPLKRGDTIKYLTGAICKMSEAEEETYTSHQSDFSVIYTSRIGGMSLLLGPARFVNHDCDPNCKFLTTNKDNITLIVLRDIKIGDEITVRYADDYFGDQNRECLCRTCEGWIRNGWAPKSVPTADDAASVRSETPVIGEPMVTRSSKRRRTGGYSPPSEKENVDLPPAKKQKLEEPVPPKPTARGKAKKSPIVSPPESDRANSEDSGAMDVEPSAQGLNTPPTTTNGTPAEDTQAPVVAAGDVTSSLLTLATIASSSSEIKSEPEEIPKYESDSSSLSEIDSEDVDEVRQIVNRRRRRRVKKRSSIPGRPVEPLRIGEGDEGRNNRVPGDYLRDIEGGGRVKCICSDCKGSFWHEDSWYIPRSCRRCERHSVIYGLIWPCTVAKNGEQRIDDPRQVHRYITASEHRKTRRKNEAALEIVERDRAKRRNSYNPSSEPRSQSRRRGGDVEVGDIGAILGEIKGTIARRA